jgi:hypothetical protein
MTEIQVQKWAPEARAIKLGISHKAGRSCVREAAHVPMVPVRGTNRFVPRRYELAPLDVTQPFPLRVDGFQSGTEAPVSLFVLRQALPQRRIVDRERGGRTVPKRVRRTACRGNIGGLTDVLSRGRGVPA